MMSLCFLLLDFQHKYSASQQKKIKSIKTAQVSKLEKWIDKMDKDLPELRNFIVYNGCEEATKAFYARAICRRAERSVIKLFERYVIENSVKKYLNRLSYLLFVLGRWLNYKSDLKDKKIA